MTQNDRVLEMIRAGWVCATEFLDEHIPRYGARIFQLQRAGHHITRRQCQRHHHESRQYEWRLAAGYSYDPSGQGTWAASA